jgi:hypothetical protein
MRGILGFLAIGAAVGLMVVGVVGYLVTQVMPYVFLVAVIVAAVHAPTRRKPPVVLDCPALTQGWTLMPMWIGDDDRDG